MDVSGLFGALTGGGNVKIDILLSTPSNSPGVVAMDHYQSWKLHKNPFWRVKHPNGTRENQQQFQTQQNPSSPFVSVTNMQQPQMIMGGNQPPIQHEPGVRQPQMQYSGIMQQRPGMPPVQQPGIMQPSHMQLNPRLNLNPPELLNEPSSLAVVAFEASQDVAGIVVLKISPGKRIEHLGVKVQFIGRIDMGHGMHEGRSHYDFISLSKELAPPGILYDSQTEIPFLFKNMDKEHESYKGRNVAVRYFVKVILERKFLPPITKELDIWVQMLGQEPSENDAIKMEVGIEDCLHIEFEYERRVFHLQDTIIGKIHFMLVRIKIKHMELAVIRRETSGEGIASTGNGNDISSRGTPAGSTVDVNNICTETQTLVKYEIMDGAPVKGEIIPVKLCLRGIPCDLTPTYKAVNNRFSVRYFLNLVLVDAEDRRYFKQQEIILYRSTLG